MTKTFKVVVIMTGLVFITNSVFQIFGFHNTGWFLALDVFNIALWCGVLTLYLA